MARDALKSSISQSIRPRRIYDDDIPLEQISPLGTNPIDQTASEDQCDKEVNKTFKDGFAELVPVQEENHLGYLSTM